MKIKQTLRPANHPAGGGADPQSCSKSQKCTLPPRSPLAWSVDPPGPQGLTFPPMSTEHLQMDNSEDTGLTLSLPLAQSQELPGDSGTLSAEPFHVMGLLCRPVVFLRSSLQSRHWRMPACQERGGQQELSKQRGHMEAPAGPGLEAWNGSKVRGCSSLVLPSLRDPTALSLSLF